MRKREWWGVAKTRSAMGGKQNGAMASDNTEPWERKNDRIGKARPKQKYLWEWERVSVRFSEFASHLPCSSFHHLSFPSLCSASDPVSLLTSAVTEWKKQNRKKTPHKIKEGRRVGEGAEGWREEGWSDAQYDISQNSHSKHLPRNK